MREIAKEREKAVAQYVFVLDIAEYLGRTSCAVAKNARRMGMPLANIRRDGTGKAALAVIAADAKRLMESDVPRAQIVRPEDLMKGAVA